jgi:hypothetical protein
MGYFAAIASAVHTKHMASEIRPTEKKDLIQVSSDTNLKSKFQGVFVALFRATPKNECPEIVNKNIDILLPFATSYLRVAAFLTKKHSVYIPCS